MAIGLSLFQNIIEMLDLQQNVSLKPFNTFGMDAIAREFAVINNECELEELISSGNLAGKKLLILGGGSNILFTRDYDGVCILLQNKGISVVGEEGDLVFVRAEAGENWNDFVQWCIKNELSGVENLSLIPGNVGSSPVQNIGAYGVELNDVLYSCGIFNLEVNEWQMLSNEDCRFGYRSSIFKERLKNKAIVWSVTFVLSRKAIIHTEYGAIAEELRAMGIKNAGIADVGEAVCNIRRRKLPDPEEIGNAGSFFKNPSVEAEQMTLLLEKFPSIVHYKNDDESYKLAAGWLIEQCGWKGYRKDDAGVHPAQALVLVNYGKATGKEILALAQEIRKSVIEKFGVELEMEVNIC